MAIQSVPVDPSLLHSPHNDVPRQKRKRSDLLAESLPEKRRVLHDAITTPPDTNFNGIEIDWKTYFGDWPPFLHKGTSIDPRRGRREGHERSYSQSRTSSDNQSVLTGESPQLWTRQHAKKMHEAGLEMDEHQTKTIVPIHFQNMREGLVNANHWPPTGPITKREALERRRKQNIDERLRVRGLTLEQLERERDEVHAEVLALKQKVEAIEWRWKQQKETME